MRKKISIVSPCYNEEGNVEELYKRISKVWENLAQYDWELILIDNCSKDKTQELIRGLCQKDSRVKAIFNVRNFGHIRSPYYALLQSYGDAVILLASDLQDPPELLKDFLESWEKGWHVVMGVKATSEESTLMFALRKFYYNLINRISDVDLVKNFTGFGLYDQRVLKDLRKIDDPYPYFRGLIAELGYPSKKIIFNQPTRKRGISANNFYTLYDIAMLGIISHSKFPLRLATFSGFALSLISFLVAVIYFVYKLVYWDRFSAGAAPLVIGGFFMWSAILFFIGIIGEYVGVIHTQVIKRPLVVEKERINFENKSTGA